MTPTEVRKLIDLAEQAKTRDLEIHAQAASRQADLIQQIDAIRLETHRQNAAAGDDFNALAKWQRWTAAETKRLQQDLVDATKVKERTRETAAIALAKVQALELLLKKALKDDLMTRRRRAEQNGQPPDA